MSQSDRLPDILQGLAALGQRGDLEMRPVLLRVLTDLFISRESHTREEIKQYEAIALGIIDKTDAPTRVIVAAKLARFGATPMSVVDRFMREGGDAAIEFLRHSTLVGQGRLLSAALDGEPEMALAVAQRLDLDADVIRALAERPEMEVVRALAANPAAPLNADIARSLVSRARRDTRLAQTLCRRLSDPAIIKPLFLHASSTQRAAIIKAARQADLINLTRPPRNIAQQMTSAEIERAAILKDRPLLLALLARSLGATLAEAEAMLVDPRGEAMALALAALRTPVDAAARIFMSLDHTIAHSHERVRALSEMVVDIAPTVARDILSSMFEKAEPRRRPTHQPVSDTTASSVPSRAMNNAREVAQPRRRGLFLIRRPA